MGEQANKRKFGWFRFTSFIVGLSGILLKINNQIMRGKAKNIAQDNDGTSENSVGYEDVSVCKNTVVNTNNFVVLHIKKDMNVYLLKEKIEFCKDNNISFSLVLDTTAGNLLDIYQDIDFLQAIIYDYGQIDMPIYCNIDNVMNNKLLNNNQKMEIVSVFAEKMEKSNAYFGFYGSDTNLDDCNNYIMNIKEYDCFLVQDKENIVYDGTCSIIKNINGEIGASTDLSEIIINNSLNMSDNLMLSAVYTAGEGDTYHSLALKFGMSEEDLRVYNNNSISELCAGDKVNIPNLYKTINNNEVLYSSNVVRGIDISDYQDNISWNRVKETSSFVIVEVSRDSTDYMDNDGIYLESAASQIKDVVDKDIALGLYCCISKEMDANIYRDRLENYFITLDNDLTEKGVILDRENIPVFLDFEIYTSNNNYYELMKVFEEVCNKHGFNRIGIYGNHSTLQAIFNGMHDANGNRVDIENTNWYVWKAGGEQYSCKESTATPIHVDTVREPSSEYLDIGLSNGEKVPVDIVQATNIGGDTGAANHRGHCDVNFCVDADVFGNSFVREANPENIETMEYVGVSLGNYASNSVNVPNVCNGIANCCTGLLAIAIGTDIIVKRKNRIRKR